MRFLTILCLTGCAAGMSVTTGYGQTYTCLPSSDSLAINLRAYVVELVTATDSATVADRVLFNLPATTANKVSIETGSSTCSTAAAKFHAAVRPPGTPAVSRTLIVIKVSTTRYVVRDMNETFGEFSPTMIFDKNWVKLAGWDS